MSLKDSCALPLSECKVTRHSHFQNFNYSVTFFIKVSVREVANKFKVTLLDKNELNLNFEAFA